MADISGVFRLARLVAKTIRGEEYPEEYLKQVNQDRRNLIPLLGRDEPMLDHSHHIRQPISSSAPVVIPDPARWHYFRYSAEKLSKLKELASQPESADPAVPFVTTDDTVNPFCSKRYATIRLARRQTLDTISRLSRAIDGRKVLGVSADYMGDLVHNVTAWMSFRDLAEKPLSAIAYYLRKELNEAQTACHIQSFATFIAQETDKSTITYSGKFDPDSDIGSLSVLCADMFPEFGKLGRPDFIRRPNFAGSPFPSLLYFFPQDPQGNCDSLACLTDADLEALNADPEWTSVVEYTG